MTMGDSAARIIPECVGLSLTLYDEDLTFTLVASSLPLAELDAMQYLDGGPCVQAVHDKAHRLEAVEELLDEDRWALFAQASAAAGVASSLSLPVLEHGRVVGGINLYASSADAFTGSPQRPGLGAGPSAAGAVTNADLAFETRLRAERHRGSCVTSRRSRWGSGSSPRARSSTWRRRRTDWCRRPSARASA